MGADFLVAGLESWAEGRAGGGVSQGCLRVTLQRLQCRFPIWD
jgi:hypothetical protein